MARRAFGIYPTGLAAVARQLGLPLDHHNAASDAAVCAEIVLRAYAEMTTADG
jgi:DNA polymerase-3 subunit epsilon